MRPFGPASIKVIASRQYLGNPGSLYRLPSEIVVIDRKKSWSSCTNLSGKFFELSHIVVHVVGLRDGD